MTHDTQDIIVDDDDDFEADKEYRATKTWSVGELELLWELKTKDRKFSVRFCFVSFFYFHFFFFMYTSIFSLVFFCFISVQFSSVH